MWWFFKRKSKASTIEEIKRVVDKLDAGIKLSFNNVKKDINHLKFRLDNHDILLTKINNLTQKLQQDQQGLAIKIKKEIDFEEIEPFLTQKISLLDNLTNLQKSILLRLKVLSKEMSEDWVAMKILAQDLYPNKDYNLIKSMVSSYTDTLLQLNLLQKKRKGREIHLSLTKKAKNLLPKKEIKIKNKLK